MKRSVIRYRYKVEDGVEYYASGSGNYRVIGNIPLTDFSITFKHGNRDEGLAFLNYIFDCSGMFVVFGCSISVYDSMKWLLDRFLAKNKYAIIYEMN